MPIIWDYVKWLPCNGHSPFAPPLSSRQCSYNLHGQSSNCKPSNPRHPSIGCRKMVQKVLGFAKFLQPLHGQAVQSLSSPRTAVFQAEENTLPAKTCHPERSRRTHHTPPIFLVQRLRFVVYWRCVLKTPPKSIFFLPSITLSFQPLFS